MNVNSRPLLSTNRQDLGVQAIAALLVTSDLMATSAAEGAARAVGVDLVVARPGAELAGLDSSTRLVAIDLTAKGVDLLALVERVRRLAPQATLLAYGPHVHEARLAGAQQAGFDVVLSRGAFYKQLADLLRRYAPTP